MVTDGIGRRNRTSWRDTSYERTVINVDAANDNPAISWPAGAVHASLTAGSPGSRRESH